MTPNKKHLFISYAHADRPAVEVLARTLEALSFDVWWDRLLKPGSAYPKVLPDKIAAAFATIVVWSQHSVNSDWVMSEAETARQAKNYFPIAIDDARPPSPFNVLHTPTVIWSAEADQFKGLDEVVSFLSDLDRDRPPPANVSEEQAILTAKQLSIEYGRTLCKLALRHTTPRSIKGKAQDGDPLFQWLYASMIYEGLGALEPKHHALAWAQQSADAGFTRAHLSLSVMLEQGTAASADLERAAHHLRTAAKGGIALAQASLGLWHRSGRNPHIELDHKQALNWFLEAAAGGSPIGQREVAWAYYTGEGIEKDENEAQHWFERAAGAGDGAALTMLGAIRADAKDGPRAIELMTAGFSAGYAPAATHLGTIYADGELTQRNDEDAVAWWRKAIVAGDTEANVVAAIHIIRARGKLDHLGYDVRYALAAALDAGSAEAAFYLGQVLALGLYGPRDEKGAREAYEHGLTLKAKNPRVHEATRAAVQRVCGVQSLAGRLLGAGSFVFL